MKKKSFIIFLILVLIMTSFAYGHSGRTDSSGGHKDNKNASGLGSYHYHHGYGPHLHTNGCPYSQTATATPTYTSTVKFDADVKSYQYKLNYLSYNCGEVDGYFGNKTSNAIKAFQKKENLIVDGILNDVTMSKIDLRYSELLASNKVNQNKTQGLSKNQLIQKKLYELGYYTGKIDGSLGPKSIAAIKKFQAANNLKVDGKCGPITSRYLGIN